MDDHSPIRVRLTENDEDDYLITRDLPTEIKDTRKFLRAASCGGILFCNASRKGELEK